MRENRIYFQVTCRKFGDSHNMTVLYHYNDMLEAYEKYKHCAQVYADLEEIEKMRISVELYKVDRSSHKVTDVATVVACGYNVVNNYIYDEETYNEMKARYYEKYDTLK